MSTHVPTRGAAGLLLLASSLLNAQMAGPIAGLKPAAGAIAEGKILVPAGADTATEIPVTVMRGSKPGPTFAVIAGLSGGDYGAITAAAMLLTAVKPAEVSGTLVVVHIANFPAFVERSGNLNPVDHKDLNNAFPGKADGTSTERIAYAITKEIIEKADDIVVLESAGANRMVQPHVFEQSSGDPKIDAKIAAMAMAFGIANIVTGPKTKYSPSLGTAAIGMGKPTLTVMSGSLGASDNRTVEYLTRGLISVMSLLELAPGPPSKTRSPLFFDKMVAVESPASGVLSLFTQRGQNIHKGDPLCSVSNYFGKSPQQLASPVDGIVLSVISTWPVSKGEPIFLIGIPRQ